MPLTKAVNRITSSPDSLSDDPECTWIVFDVVAVVGCRWLLSDIRSGGVLILQEDPGVGGGAEGCRQQHEVP